MSFDPSTLTVKKATEKLDGLSDDDLAAVYDSELDGKGRKSLLDAITGVRDDMREDAPVEEVIEEVAAAPREIGIDEIRSMQPRERRKWRSVSYGRFVEIG